LLQFLFLLGQLAFELRKLAVFQLRGAIEIVFALRLLDRRFGFLDLFPQASQPEDRLLFAFPARLNWV
jgi:hypothetical protein